jgi:hypothetical protein
MKKASWFAVMILIGFVTVGCSKNNLLDGDDDNNPNPGSGTATLVFTLEGDTGWIEGKNFVKDGKMQCTFKEVNGIDVPLWFTPSGDLAAGNLLWGRLGGNEVWLNISCPKLEGAVADEANKVIFVKAWRDAKIKSVRIKQFT